MYVVSNSSNSLLWCVCCTLRPMFLWLYLGSSLLRPHLKKCVQSLLSPWMTFYSLKYLFTKFDPGLGRSPGEGKGCPLQYSGLENSMDCTVHGVAKSWTPDRTERLSLSLYQVSCKVVWWLKSGDSGFWTSESESLPALLLNMVHSSHKFGQIFN